MRNLAQPKRAARLAGSADAASHRRPAVSKGGDVPGASLKLATSFPPGPALQAKESGSGGATADGAVHARGVHAIAERGVAGTGGELPYRSTLERAFVGHDLGGVRAHVGGESARAAVDLGARAYTLGERIAFRGTPDLSLAAHEATHVLQQRGGVELPDGVGQAADPYERHADAVAEAVVAGRPLGDLLTPLGHAAAGESAVQAKDAGEEDVDAVERAGNRANESVAKNEESDTRMMLDASSIFFRLMRSFFPEALTKWHFSGVAYRREFTGITLNRRAGDVEVTVGREFVLGAKEHGLASRILSLDVALQMLDGGPQALVAATASTGGPPTRSEALKEAGTLFASKAQFGFAEGSERGVDPNDSYDARYWVEAGRAIVAKGDPWFAVSQMILHLGDDVPKAGGGTTRWHFDCFEGAQVEALYADWRTLSRDAFNKRNAPLKIGFSASRANYEKAVEAERPGGAPFTRSDEPQATRGPRGDTRFEYVKTPVGKTMAEVLDQAPPGAWIVWTNRDVTARIRSFSARKEAGQTLSAQEQELYDRISPWENENALKVSKDRYAAFPFGVTDEQTIVRRMAEIVFEPNPVPAGYVERNIFISAVQVPKEPGRTTT